MRASARSLHLYASVAVCRRPSVQATDVDASPTRVRALRQVTAAVIRCVLPSAERWRCLPAETGRVSLSALPEDWRTLAADALQASRRGDVDAAGDAAATLSEWTERARLPLASAMLAEAAALCRLRDPDRLLRVAVLAHARGDHAATLSWAQRARHLTRDGKRVDVAIYSRALLGEAWEARGEFRLAVRYYRSAYRAARRAKLWEYAARAAHSAFSALWEAGEMDRAGEAARLALSLYPSGHPHLAAMAHDVALWRLDGGTVADAARALQVVRFLSSERPRDVLRFGATMALAAAIVGDRRTYRVGVAKAITAMYETRYGEGSPAAYVQLARAALVVGDVPDARRWAQRGRTLAAERGEKKAERAAVDVLLRAL